MQDFSAVNGKIALIQANMYADGPCATSKAAWNAQNSGAVGGMKRV